jgi:hypothetical protein
VEERSTTAEREWRGKSRKKLRTGHPSSLSNGPKRQGEKIKKKGDSKPKGRGVERVE